MAVKVSKDEEKTMEKTSRTGACHGETECFDYPTAPGPKPRPRWHKSTEIV